MGDEFLREWWEPEDDRDRQTRFSSDGELQDGSPVGEKPRAPEYEIDDMGDCDGLHLREAKSLLRSGRKVLEPAGDVVRASEEMLEYRDKTPVTLVELHDNDREETETVTFVSHRRGSEGYAKEVRNRILDWMEDLEKKVENSDWDGNFVDIGQRRGYQETPGILVTLTVDDEEASVLEMLNNVGEYFNAFKEKLRREFEHKRRCGDAGCRGHSVEDCPDCETRRPTIRQVRAWEVQGRGQLHIHALLVVDGGELGGGGFRAFHNGGGRFDWRVLENERISDCWEYGYVDVKGVTDAKSAVNYILKYLTKNVTALDEWEENGKPKNEHGLPPGGVLAMLYAWVFNMQLYAISYESGRGIGFISLVLSWGGLPRLEPGKEDSSGEMVPEDVSRAFRWLMRGGGPRWEVNVLGTVWLRFRDEVPPGGAMIPSGDAEADIIGTLIDADKFESY